MKTPGQQDPFLLRDKEQKGLNDPTYQKRLLTERRYVIEGHITLYDSCDNPGFIDLSYNVGSINKQCGNHLKNQSRLVHSCIKVESCSSIGKYCAFFLSFLPFFTYSFGNMKRGYRSISQHAYCDEKSCSVCDISRRDTGLLLDRFRQWCYPRPYYGVQTHPLLANEKGFVPQTRPWTRRLVLGVLITVCVMFVTDFLRSSWAAFQQGIKRKMDHWDDLISSCLFVMLFSLYMISVSAVPGSRDAHQDTAFQWLHPRIFSLLRFRASHGWLTRRQGAS